MTTKQGVVQEVEDDTAVVEIEGKLKELKRSRWNADYEPQMGDEVEVTFEDATLRYLRPVGQEIRRREAKLIRPESASRSASPKIGGDRRTTAAAAEGGSNSRRNQSGDRFRNPKNFVPTPPRPAVGSILGDVGDDGMRHRWHGRAHDGGYTGVITVQATVLTDLLISDSPRRTAGGDASTPKDHFTFPLRMAGERALMPATSLKGAIRSAVEAVSNSRMAIFTATEKYSIRVRSGNRFVKQFDKSSPKDLLRCDLRPASRLEELSPADVLFGWVGQDGGGALHGRVAVDDGYIGAEYVVRDDRTLSILASPKPKQSRFYVGIEADGEIEPLPSGLEPREIRYDGLKVKKNGSEYGKALRGRAVYVRQSSLVDGEWKGTVKDNQNRTVTSWVKAGAQFTFDVHVRDVTLWELGLLLFVINGAGSGRDLNLGFGKPLGFGSVSLSVESAVLRTTEELISWLLKPDEQETGSSTKSDSVLGDAQEAFETESKNAFGKPFAELPHIQAWCAARRVGSLPVHYPRTKKNRSETAPSFKWFSANESGPRLSLPDLRNDEGLPYTPSAAGEQGGGDDRGH